MESITALTADVVARLRAAGCVFAEDEARLVTSEAETEAGLDAMVLRRASGVPLEQVLGWAEFCGMRIAVEPGVFVPRRRTEFLIEQATQLTTPRAVVVDLCCGTGALGAAIASRGERVELHAADLEEVAVRCARRNLTGTGAHVYQGDLLDPLPPSLRGRVQVLLANAPYVPSDAIGMMPAEARDHEPRVTLDGGGDGLRVLMRIIAEAPRWLAPGGHLLFEVSELQAAAATGEVARNGLRPRVARAEERDATVVVATSTRSPAAFTD